MTQALYAHMNNKTIKKKVTEPLSLLDDLSPITIQYFSLSRLFKMMGTLLFHKAFIPVLDFSIQTLIFLLDPNLY
jgi:hypothetical protein